MITELTHKYLNGETTAAEERQLLQLLKDEPRPTAEQKALALMLKASPVDRDATWMEEDESALYDAILQDRRNVASRHRIWPWISPVFAVKYVYATKQYITRRLYRFFLVSSNQTSIRHRNFYSI